MSLPSDKKKSTQKAPKKTPNKKPKQDRKKLIMELDNLWRQIINLRWKHKCAICGSAGVHAHHFFGKKACSSVRWNTDNGVLLCFYDHIGKVHQQGLVEPVRDKLIEQIGQTAFDLLKVDAYKVHKFTMDDLRILQEKLEREFYGFY